MSCNLCQILEFLLGLCRQQLGSIKAHALRQGFDVAPVILLITPDCFPSRSPQKLNLIGHMLGPVKLDKGFSNGAKTAVAQLLVLFYLINWYYFSFFSSFAACGGAGGRSRCGERQLMLVRELVAFLLMRAA